MIEGFNLLTDVEVIDEIANILLKGRPSEGGGDVMVCSSYASMS